MAASAKSEPVTLDRATKINLGVLGVLLAAVAGGATHLTTLRADVVRMDHSLGEVKAALERNTTQIQNDSKSLAVLETLMKSFDERLRKLEQK